jgi:hypothetical protein
MSIYSDRQENAAIDAMLRDVALPPPPPSRLYLDPEGGFLRQTGWQRTKQQTDRLIRCMAAAMAKLAAGNGACTEADLRAHGFTLAEIAAHRDSALAIARTAAPAASW